MSKDFTPQEEAMFEQFEDAYGYLQHIVKQLESDSLPLNELADKVKEARKIAEQCEEELRTVQNNIKKGDTN